MIGYKILSAKQKFFDYKTTTRNDILVATLKIPDEVPIKYFDEYQCHAAASKAIPIKIQYLNGEKATEGWSPFGFREFMLHYILNKEIDDTDNYNNYAYGGINFWTTKEELERDIYGQLKDYGWE